MRSHPRIFSATGRESWEAHSETLGSAVYPMATNTDSRLSLATPLSYDSVCKVSA